MNAPAAIQASFADFRVIKTRKVAQFCFEVPLEKADEALRALGGLPQAQDERWCGIARLNASKPVSDAPKQRTAWVDLKPSAQAAIRCGEPEFRKWLAKDDPNFQMYDGDMAACEVRERCGVISRRELDEQETAATRWRQLDGAYDRARRGQQ